jgi:hypothetical protein
MERVGAASRRAAGCRWLVGAGFGGRRDVVGDGIVVEVTGKRIGGAMSGTVGWEGIGTLGRWSWVVGIVAVEPARVVSVAAEVGRMIDVAEQEVAKLSVKRAVHDPDDLDARSSVKWCYVLDRPSDCSLSTVVLLRPVSMGATAGAQLAKEPGAAVLAARRMGSRWWRQGLVLPAEVS